MRSRAHPWLRGAGLAAAACMVTLTTGALVSASGVLADATPAGPQAVRVHLAYRCRFAGGSVRAGVTVAGRFPSAAVAGEPIRLSALRTTVVFRHPAVARLRKLGASAVTGRDVLAVTVADGTHAVTSLWPGAARRPVPLPRAGRWHLTFSGTVPPVAASTPGTVTFTAAGLSLALGHPGIRAIAASPAAMTLACTPVRGKDAELAVVPVTAAAQPGRPGGGRHLTGPSAPQGGGIPPGCAKRLTRRSYPGQVLGCAHLIGYADVFKLQEAGLVGRGPDGVPPAAFLHVDSYASDIGCVPPEPTLAACTANNGVIHVYTCTIAQLDYHKQLEFPPVTATFLNFGFVPVTTVLQLTETTWPASNPPTENRKCYTGFNKNKPVRLTSPVVTVFTDLNDSAIAKYPVLNISSTYLAIHVAQVEVNGVPLSVGAGCGTSQPIQAVLTGHGHNGPPPTGYTLDDGGPLTGNVTIPAFQHCGVGENLDPLLDAGISGPMNFQLLTQGTLCTPEQTNKPGCPPTVPRPRRHP